MKERNIINAMMSGILNPARFFIDWIRGDNMSSGARVNVNTVIGNPPAAFALRKISDKIADTPLKLYRQLDRGRDRAASHPVDKLLLVRPNPLMTASAFKSVMTLHALLRGNGRAYIRRVAGVPVELLPLPPEQTTTCIVDGEKWHVFWPSDDDEPIANRPNIPDPDVIKDGCTTGYKFPDRDVLHVMGMSWNGYWGMPLIELAKDALGIGIAAQKAVASSFQNGSRPSVVIEVPHGKLRDPKEASEFLDSFNAAHSGLDNAGRAALIREGMKMSTLPVSASDAQWLEQRKFQRVDVALLFGLESMPGDDSSVSYNSLEQKDRSFVSNCLMPWLTRWEQECTYKLLGESTRRSHFFRFDVDEWLRPESSVRAENYQKLIAARVMSPNEAREREGLNPYPGGDVYENPAVTPGSGGGADEPDEDTEDLVTPAEANRRAVVAHLTNMLGVEQRRVLAAAGNKKDYLKWLDSFYEDWSPRFADSVENIGGCRSIAETHCEQNRSQLRELAGSVPLDGQADAVAEATADWKARADAMATEILNPKEPAHAA